LWELIRAEGRRAFIIRFGVWRFGIQSGAFLWLVLFVIIPVFFGEGLDVPNFAYIGSRPFWLSLLAALVLWPAAGYVWGAWEWRRREARFRGHEQRLPPGS
ncbi:MAG: hypothetical protein M3483_08670, partial [Gemmatimonadota bacterium]|nr:hypothetical protein [Gemmatimonadota bacterium]